MKKIGRLQFGWSRPETTESGATGEEGTLPAESEPRSQGPIGIAKLIYRGALPLAAVALLGVGYGLWSWTHGPAFGAPAHHHRPVAAPAAPAAAQPPAPPPQPAAEADWEQNSPGYQSWLDVGSDVYQLGQDMNAGNDIALFGVGGDGFKLAQAAGAALQNPSPVDRHDYKKAMANWGFVGVALTNSNVNDADKFAKVAQRAMNAWATAAQPGATGIQGCGDWNLPQSSNC